VISFCEEKPENCEISQLTENLTKNVFVLMGKLTSLAETISTFPADDQGDFKE